MTDAPKPSDPASAVEPRGSTRRFLFGFVMGLLLLGASVTTLNVVADPYGYAGSGIFATAILSDRPIKACLIERLPRAPSLMIFGSSRAEKIEPSHLQQRTGLVGFNAAVSSAGPDDAWAFANLLHQKAAGAQQRVLWMLDVESLRARPIDPGLLDTPSLDRFVRQSSALHGRVQSLWSFVSWHTALDSWKSVDATLFGNAQPLSRRTCSIHTNGVTEYAPDGYRSFDFHDVAVRRGLSLARTIGITLSEYRTIYQGDTRLSPTAERRFEQTISTMNSWNIRPVIVLTPVHPKFARVIGPLGWTLRHRQLVTYLHSLMPRLSFDLLDASNIKTFGGTSRGFYDGVHMKVTNVRRLLDWVVSKARRDLRPGG
ncbi:MAG: hypothetical protein QOH15_848 [Gaiellales bacterium]|nr:hypothetical protein [Gaiellaceae bacterium]MDX6568270.1 hypothetical protein [Gaiellales bacterium]